MSRRAYSTERRVHGTVLKQPLVGESSGAGADAARLSHYINILNYLTIPAYKKIVKLYPWVSELRHREHMYKPDGYMAYGKDWIGYRSAKYKELLSMMPVVKELYGKLLLLGAFDWE